MHDRYYSTISKVETNQRYMIKGLSLVEGIGSNAEKNIKSFEGIFDVLRDLLPVKITQEGKEIYSNILSNDDLKLKKNRRYYWEGLKEEPSSFSLGDSSYTIEVDTYIPPKWSSEFLRWIKQPGKWFTPRFDFITIPFLMFAFLFYWILWARLWLYRSRYLSREIKEAIADIKETPVNSISEK